VRWCLLVLAEGAHAAQARPKPVKRTGWPPLDANAEYERTLWLAASPFSIRRTSGSNKAQDGPQPTGTNGSAFVPWPSGRARAPAHDAAPGPVGPPWEARLPDIAKPGGKPVGDVATWKAVAHWMDARRLASRGQLQKPYLPRLECLEGLDSSVSHVFETAAGLGTRADVIQAAVARYKAITAPP
jgi:hypothetical protein